MATSEHVAIFWDYENCRPPANASGYVVADRIRRVAQAFGSVTLFKAYFEVAAESTNLKAAVLHSELQSSGVSLTHCPHNGKKDVADKMMLVDMLAYAIDKPAPATIIIISGDRDFAYGVSVLKLRRYNMVIIVPPVCAHPSLKVQATALLNWQDDVLGSTEVNFNADSTASLRNNSNSCSVQTSQPIAKPMTPGLDPSSTLLTSPPLLTRRERRSGSASCPPWRLDPLGESAPKLASYTPYNHDQMECPASLSVPLHTDSPAISFTSGEPPAVAFSDSHIAENDDAAGPPSESSTPPHRVSPETPVLLLSAISPSDETPSKESHISQDPHSNFDIASEVCADPETSSSKTWATLFRTMPLSSKQERPPVTDGCGLSVQPLDVLHSDSSGSESREPYHSFANPAVALVAREFDDLHEVGPVDDNPYEPSAEEDGTGAFLDRNPYQEMDMSLPANHSSTYIETTSSLSSFTVDDSITLSPSTTPDLTLAESISVSDPAPTSLVSVASFPIEAFNPLVTVLKRRQTRGERRPFWSSIGEELMKLDSGAYARVGVNKLKKYMELAQCANLVVVGGLSAPGRQWIELKPTVKLSRVTSGHVANCTSAATQNQGASYFMVEGLQTPVSLSPPAQNPTPTLASVSFPRGAFDGLITILRRLRLEGNPKPGWTQVGTDLKKAIPDPYALAGVSKLKKYLELAESANLVVIGGYSPEKEVELNPIFHPLITLLEKFPKENRPMLQRVLGKQLSKEFPHTYGPAGGAGLQQYMEMAEKAGLVSLGKTSVRGSDWIELRGA